MNSKKIGVGTTTPDAMFTMKDLLEQMSKIMKEIDESKSSFVINVDVAEHKDGGFSLHEDLNVMFQPTFSLTRIDCEFVPCNPNARDYMRKEDDHAGQIWSEYNQCWVWL